jgi:ElaB/YqjD/DUF883 family membrane-anchored ribosome-binding protein
MVNKFRPGSKRHKIVEIMNANAHQPMEAVIQLIVEGTGCEERLARHDYTWMTREGVALGQAPTKVRTVKAKAEKAPKQPKVRTVKAKAAKVLKDAVAKSADEIAEIKAKNLEALRKVSKQHSKIREYGVGRVASPEGEGVTDFDPQLAREEVDAILADEGLTKYVPEFMRD